MITFRAALRRILARPVSLGAEKCLILGAAGRVLASDFRAPESMPRATYSMMDGYAVRARDVAGATAQRPMIVSVIGESRPGYPHSGRRIGPGKGVAIATGGIVPRGADTIVPVEWTSESAPGRVSISRAPQIATYFRWAGGDVKKGALLFRRGTRIDAPTMAAIAQFGVQHVRVVRRPRVGLLTSGDEVIALGRPRRGDQIIATNLYYAQRVLGDFGCEARVFGIAPDRAGALKALLKKALEWSDVVVTSAGVSAGKRDLVVPVLESLGAEIVFHRVAIKPGHPTLFARVKGVPVFGLPGNPLSGACAMEIFIKPYLLKCLGATAPDFGRMRAPLSAPVARDSRRLTFLFSHLDWTPDGPRVHPPGKQESGNLTLLARANCLAEIPPGEGTVAAGDRVRLWPLR